MSSNPCPSFRYFISIAILWKAIWIFARKNAGRIGILATQTSHGSGSISCGSSADDSLSSGCRSINPFELLDLQQPNICSKNNNVPDIVVMAASPSSSGCANVKETSFILQKNGYRVLHYCCPTRLGIKVSVYSHCFTYDICIFIHFIVVYYMRFVKENLLNNSSIAK